MQNLDPFAPLSFTSTTTPLYNRVIEAEIKCFKQFQGVFTDVIRRQSIPYEERVPATPEDFASVNEATKEFYNVIRETAPACDDRAAAERCVRLAMMLMDEALCWNGKTDIQPLIHEIAMELRKARMQACAAIGLADEDDLPTPSQLMQSQFAPRVR